MKTGNTRHCVRGRLHEIGASMEPGHEDREYFAHVPDREIRQRASMEPGHEDREYRGSSSLARRQQLASMEPGHEDREYQRCRILPVVRLDASMEPGHEDREYRPHPVGDSAGEKPQWSPVMKTGNTTGSKLVGAAVAGLNGARS